MTSRRKEKNYEENILITGANRSTNPIVVIYSHSKKSLKNKVAAVNVIKYDWRSSYSIPTSSHHSHSDHFSDEIDAQMIPNYCICCYPRYIPLIYL